MALYKRRGIWHTDFTVNGQRVRQTLETRDWRQAKQKEKDLIARAKEGKLATGRMASLARLSVDDAFTRYLEQRKIEILNACHEGDISKPVRAFFQNRRLNHISSEDIKAYQSHRVTQRRMPKTVNLEVGVLL